MKTLIFEESFEEVSIFESYYKYIFIGNENVVIPYINVGVSNHPLSIGRELLYIDMSYVVCENASIFKKNEVDLGRFNGSKKIYHLGGISILEMVGNSIDICCSRAFLQIFPISQIAVDPFIPINTPNIAANMDRKKVDDFYDGIDMPTNLVRLLGERLIKWDEPIN